MRDLKTTKLTGEIFNSENIIPTSCCPINYMHKLVRKFGVNVVDSNKLNNELFMVYSIMWFSLNKGNEYGANLKLRK